MMVCDRLSIVYDLLPRIYFRLKESAHMVFIWVIFYGLMYALSRHISYYMHPETWLTPLLMSVYVFILLAWLVRTGRSRKIGLHPPSRRLIKNSGLLFPLAVLPVCNLLYTRQLSASWDAVVLLLCAAVAEELLFRGWLLHRLIKKPSSAIVVSSLAFSLLHAANLVHASSWQAVFLQMMSAFFFGLCFGMITLRCASLFPSILAHILVNLTGMSASPPGLAIIACIAVYALCALRLCRLTQFNPKEKQS